MDRRFYKKLLYFSVLAACALVVAGLLQTSFFPALGLFGVVPDLVLVLVCGVAFYLGAVDGAVMGLLGGILLEGLGGFGPALAPLFYVAAGVAFGALSTAAFRAKFWHWAVYSGLFCAAKALYSVARIVFSQNGGSLGRALLVSILPEYILTWLLALALTVPVKWLAGVLRGRQDQKKGKGGLGDL